MLITKRPDPGKPFRKTEITRRQDGLCSLLQTRGQVPQVHLKVAPQVIEVHFRPEP